MTARFIPGVRDVSTLIGHTVCDRRVRLLYDTRMIGNLLVTIQVITVRAFRHCLFCSPCVGQTELQFEHKDGAPVNQPISTFSNLSLIVALSLWIMRSDLAWTGPRRLFLQTPFRFVSPQCNSPWVNLASWFSGLRLAHNGCPESAHE